MKYVETGINKVGYSSLAGVLSLAYVSDTDPLNGGLYFALAFIVVFALIFVLEKMHAMNAAVHEREVDRGLR